MSAITADRMNVPLSRSTTGKERLHLDGIFQPEAAPDLF